MRRGNPDENPDNFDDIGYGSATCPRPEVRATAEASYDDHPFIVLTETKFSFRCIPVGIGTLFTGLGLKKKTHVMMLSP